MLIKKYLIFIFVYILSFPLFADDASVCNKLISDQSARRTMPGLYYHQIAMCQFEFINSRETFNEVIKMLIRSAEYKYTPSYFALGVLYYDKFTDGKIWFNDYGNLGDLKRSIYFLEKIAPFSATAENYLGEIYLDEANISNKTQADYEKIEGVNKVLPDIDKAIFWLERAAKHGNPAAQGTLSDLYIQGIGVPQNYVLGYVWQNLSSASQFRFNHSMQQDTVGRELVNKQMEYTKKQYNKLTEMQKNEAQILLDRYSKLYFASPQKIDLMCLSIQRYIAGTLVLKILK